MDERKMIAMTAAMEGQSTALRVAGHKRKVSELELFVLCNMAHLGCLSIFSSLGGDTGGRALREMELFCDALRDVLHQEGKVPGLNRIVQSCVAILDQERLGKYIVKPGEAEAKEGQP